MYSTFLKKEGFTLIELLVVVAIVGLLSSIVLASLNGAREKSRLSALKQQMEQFRLAINLSYDTINSYFPSVSNYTAYPIQYGIWLNTTSDCDYSYGPGSTFAANDSVGAARLLPICKKIINFANNSDNRLIYTLIVFGDTNKYSISVWSQDAGGHLFCMGSSGVTFTLTDYYTPGCYYNP